MITLLWNDWDWILAHFLVILPFLHTAKTPAAELKRMVSSHESPTHKDLLDEVKLLRTQNKVLKAAINAVKDTATEKLTKSYELVWYARNRSKFS